jgi:hypothetical protein
VGAAAPERQTGRWRVQPAGRTRYCLDIPDVPYVADDHQPLPDPSHRPRACRGGVETSVDTACPVSTFAQSRWWRSSRTHRHTPSPSSTPRWTRPGAHCGELTMKTVSPASSVYPDTGFQRYRRRNVNQLSVFWLQRPPIRTAPVARVIRSPEDDHTHCLARSTSPPPQ